MISLTMTSQREERELKALEDSKGRETERGINIV